MLEIKLLEILTILWEQKNIDGYVTTCSDLIIKAGD